MSAANALKGASLGSENTLNIYTKIESIPKDKRLITDCEAAFGSMKLKDDEFTRRVLQEVEQAEYIDSITFRDRFGRALYVSCLSTGVKSLLCIYYLPDYVFDICEMGQNARVYLSLIPKGNFYVSDWDFELYSCQDDDKLNVKVNGVLYHAYDEINEAIGGY